MTEYQQMLDELAKLSLDELEERKRFFDEWAQLDQIGRELLHQVEELKLKRLAEEERIKC